MGMLGPNKANFHQLFTCKIDTVRYGTDTYLFSWTKLVYLFVYVADMRLQAGPEGGPVRALWALVVPQVQPLVHGAPVVAERCAPPGEGTQQAAVRFPASMISRKISPEIREIGKV